MEPRSIERGKNEPSLEESPSSTEASMEPRSIERGKSDMRNQFGDAELASMEPRSIERGKLRTVGGSQSAVLLLQWSRDQLNAERTREKLVLPFTLRFNGAAIN